MPNANGLRKGLVTSLLTIALATGVGAYGTFAYFNDTEESSMNVFSSGTLDLALSSSSSVDAFVGHDNFAPGDVENGTLLLENEGSISSYDGDGHDVSLSLGVFLDQTDADGGTTDMADHLELTQLAYGSQDLTSQVADANDNGRTDLADLVASNVTGLDDPGSAGQDLDVEITFAQDAGNDLQGDSVDATFTFVLEQR
jgi:predicted ribosomally synthesized peptide with SipW-like signal peptide